MTLLHTHDGVFTLDPVPTQHQNQWDASLHTPMTFIDPSPTPNTQPHGHKPITRSHPHLEDSRHGCVVVLVSVSIGLLQLENVRVTTILSCLLLLPQNGGQLQSIHIYIHACTHTHVRARAHTHTHTLSILAFVEFGSLSAFSSVCMAVSPSSLAFSYAFFACTARRDEVRHKDNHHVPLMQCP